MDEVLKSSDNDYPIESINIDDIDNFDTLTKYKVRAIPTLVFVNDSGEEQARMAGLVSIESLNSWLRVQKGGSIHE